MTFLTDLLANVFLGVVTTVIGIVIVFLVAAPKIRMRPEIVGWKAAGVPTRYWFQFQSARRLPIFDVRVRVSIVLLAKGAALRTSIPVPVSVDELHVVRVVRGRWESPRLLLERIDWEGRLPPGTAKPTNPDDLKAILHELDAHLLASVSATASIFQVVRNYQHKYSEAEIEVFSESPVAGE